LRQYESTFVLDAHLPTETTDATIDKITKYIESNGGKIKLVDRWGKRRLAYEIKKKQYGYYAYFRYEAEGTFIKEFEREFKLDETVLRSLTVVVPKVAIKQEERLAKKKAEKKAQKPKVNEKPVHAETKPQFENTVSQSNEDDKKEDEEANDA